LGDRNDVRSFYRVLIPAIPGEFPNFWPESECLAARGLWWSLSGSHQDHDMRVGDLWKRDPPREHLRTEGECHEKSNNRYAGQEFTSTMTIARE